MNILIVFTGGTIGGDFDNRGIIDSSIRAKPFITLLRDEILNDPLMHSISLAHVVTPLNRFSEQMTPNDWTVIAKTVYEAVTASTTLPDGIVILHGTDTLSFTAAALSFLLLGIKIPIVITGSTLPLVAPNSDAKRNVLDALRVASDSRFRGVFVVFSGDPMRPSDIIAGTRARKQSYPEPPRFFSLNSGLLGRIKEARLLRSSIFIEDTTLLTRITSSNEAATLLAPGRVNDGIAYFQIYPGFSPEHVTRAVNDGVGGIVLDLYNSGTACTQGSLSLLGSVQYAISKRVPVFASSQHLGPTDMYTYVSSRELRDTGVVPLHGMAHEAAITKLMWLLSKFPDRKQFNDVITGMTTDVCGELGVGNLTASSPMLSVAFS